MLLMHVGLLLLLFCSAYSDQYSSAGYGPFVTNADEEWESMKAVVGDEMTQASPETDSGAAPLGRSSPLQAKLVTQFRSILGSQDHKRLFNPEKGLRRLPSLARKILLEGSFIDPVTTNEPNLAEMMCNFDRMYVRVKKEVFNSIDAYKYLKLGNCAVNQGTSSHYYLLYLLGSDCGFETESTPDFVVINNVLHYEPSGVVLRDMPFQIPLRCQLPRFFHSYKVGFHPKLQGGTIFKALQPKSGFTLTPLDASGNQISRTRTYTLGDEMFFEAKQSGAARSNQRLYINKCFMTVSRDPKSSPNYTFIDNQGCMVDGMVTPKSKFLPGASKMVLQFKVVAVLFRDLTSESSQQLYMHCDTSIGNVVPTPSSKSCNYRPDTNTWEELYGEHSVCSCCSSTCVPQSPRALSSIVSSRSWKVSKDNEDDPWKSNSFSWEESDVDEDLMSFSEDD